MKSKGSRFYLRAITVFALIAAVIFAGFLLTGGSRRGEDAIGFDGSYSLTEFPVYLDGYKIQGYYCDEKILISLDDLARYGFELNYDADRNMINLRGLSDIEGSPEPRAISVTAGKAQSCALDTRINGVKIKAYSLDGRACVCVDDLVELTDEFNRWWGWSDYNMNGGFDAAAGAFNISVFRPKVWDWAALLSDMEDKVNKPELELYTEAPPDEAEYFGGRLEPKAGVYAGIVSDGNGDPETGKPPVFDHDFGLYSSYIEFDDFQTVLNKPSSYLVPEKNAVSQVPWNISDINLALDPKNDGYIHETLDNLAAMDKPTIIRFGGEMNIGTLGDSPSAYVKAFRRIADIVHTYPDFAVMWSPNDSGSLDRPFWYYWPGDEYVDWVGVSSFSKKDFFSSLDVVDGSAPVTSRESQIYFTLGDFGFTTNSLKYITDFMDERNIKKPLAISEGGVVSRLSYTDENIDEWGGTRMRNMYWYAAMRYPQLKSIVYFNHDMESEVIGFDLSDRTDYIKIMDEAFSNGQYLMSGDASPRFVFAPARDRKYGSGHIPIYGYVYLPEDRVEQVDYYLDGGLFDTEYEIPYKTSVDVSALTEGAHIFVMEARGEKSTESLKYTIKKSAGVAEIY